MIKDNEENERTQERQSAQIEKSCYQFLYGLLGALDNCLDRRLVETFLALVLVVIMHHHRNNGLLLSELGGISKSRIRLRPGRSGSVACCIHRDGGRR